LVGGFAKKQATLGRVVVGFTTATCKKLLLADEFGVIVHDDIPHPPDMSFDEDKKPQ